MQFFLQWYMIAVYYFYVRLPTNAQVFSLFKSQLIFPLGFAKICLPQIFHGDQEEPLSKKIKRIAWSLNLIYTLILLFLQSFKISALYLSEGESKRYFLLPVAISCGFLLVVLVLDKLFNESWVSKLKCVAFAFLFLSIGTLGCQFVFTRYQYIFYTNIMAFVYSLRYFLMVLHGFYYFCVFGKASLLSSTSVSSIWDPDQLLGSGYVSYFVTSIPIFLNMVIIAQLVYYQTIPDNVTLYCPDVDPGQI